MFYSLIYLLYFIISKCLYNYADAYLKLQIVNTLYRNIYNSSLNDYNNIFQRYIFTEYIDKKLGIVKLSNNSYELGEDLADIPKLAK